MQPTHETAAGAAAKLTVVWSGVVAGMSSWDWGQVAAMLASAYSVILILEKLGIKLSDWLSKWMWWRK